jgi:hypothetical protein
MIRQVEKELILIVTGLSMLDSGKMINKMELENKNGLMGRSTKASIKMDPKTEKDC